jgi:hypothetical protein
VEVLLVALHGEGAMDVGERGGLFEAHGDTLIKDEHELEGSLAHVVVIAEGFDGVGE